MENDIKYIELFEIYKDLLTDTQKEMFNSHFLLDLSLAEVAENFDTSRQSVSDAIKKVKIKLEDYENKLKIKEKNDILNMLIETTKDEKLKKLIKGIVEL